MTIERVLNFRPAFYESYSFGWDMMKKNFLRLFLVVIACGVAMAPLGMMSDDTIIHSAGQVILNVLAMAYFFLVTPVINYGGNYIFLQSVRQKEVDFRELVRGFSIYLNVILANLLVCALVGIALVALVVPGIIVACRLAFVSYLVMDRNLDPVTAVEESWRLTRGLGWTIFGMAVAGFFILILGLICLVVGIFPAVIWIQASFATLYQAAVEDKDGSEVTAGEPATEG